MFVRDSKFASKTRKVGRALSFNKTPNKLKRAVSSMMSPFANHNGLTPSSQLANLQLAALPPIPVSERRVKLIRSWNCEILRTVFLFKTLQFEPSIWQKVIKKYSDQYCLWVGNVRFSNPLAHLLFNGWFINIWSSNFIEWIEHHNANINSKILILYLP